MTGDRHAPEVELGWAHLLGQVDLGPLRPSPDGASEALERQLISETAHRYAWAFDERRVDILADLFTEDVAFSFSVRGDDPVDASGREEVMTMLQASMLPGLGTRHLLVNHVVERLTENAAELFVYFVLLVTREPWLPVSSGFYRFFLRKIGSRWLAEKVVNGLDVAFDTGQIRHHPDGTSS